LYRFSPAGQRLENSRPKNLGLQLVRRWKQKRQKGQKKKKNLFIPFALFAFFASIPTSIAQVEKSSMRWKKTEASFV
jgi:hypothetical protein